MGWTERASEALKQVLPFRDVSELYGVRAVHKKPAEAVDRPSQQAFSNV